MGKIKKYIRRNKRIFRDIPMVLVLFIGIFPLVVGVFYYLPLPRIISIDSGDLLSYYGVAFGILGSFITYRYETDRKEKERDRELKPIFGVELQRDKSGVFNLKIVKHSKREAFCIYLYDKYIQNTIDKADLYITFNEDKEKVKSLKNVYGQDGYVNITLETDDMDDDGYPKYIQILCDDVDGRTWNCVYQKAHDEGKKHYYTELIEIL